MFGVPAIEGVSATGEPVEADVRIRGQIVLLRVLSPQPHSRLSW